MFSKSHIFIYLTIFFAIPLILLSQGPVGNLGNGIIFHTEPEFPRAFQEVSISVQGFSIDLGRLEVSWYIDGKLIERSIGGKNFSFNAGKLGSRSTIIMVANSPIAEVARKTIVIVPADVDILWETNTYTPPFYKGKSLPVSEGNITFTAMPSFIDSRGRKIDPEILMYTWQKDGTVLVDQSGVGKKNITIVGPLSFSDDIISLEVSTLEMSIKAKETVFIVTREPKIIFYEKHPLRGVLYERAIINEFFLLDDEFTLRAEPFFTHIDGIQKGNTEFSWSVGEEKVFPEKEQELVLSRGGESGATNVKLRVRDFEKLLQASASFLLRF